MLKAACICTAIAAPSRPHLHTKAKTVAWHVAWQRLLGPHPASASQRLWAHVASVSEVPHLIGPQRLHWEHLPQLAMVIGGGGCCRTSCCAAATTTQTSVHGVPLPHTVLRREWLQGLMLLL